MLSNLAVVLQITLYELIILKLDSHYSVFFISEKSNLRTRKIIRLKRLLFLETVKENFATDIGAIGTEHTFAIDPQKISKISVKGTKNTGLTVTYAKHLLKDGVDYKLEYDEASIKKNKIKVTIKAVETEGASFCIL